MAAFRIPGVLLGPALIGLAGVSPSLAQENRAWSFARNAAGATLSFGVPGDPDVAISFACGPAGGDIRVLIGETSPRVKPNETEQVTLTIGGVKWSFAGRTVANPASKTASVDMNVPARNPVFTSLGNPGGMKIEGKGFAKIVPSKGLPDKARQFLAFCRRSSA